jgi:hypothetical protein
MTADRDNQNKLYSIRVAQVSSLLYYSQEESCIFILCGSYRE